MLGEATFLPPPPGCFGKRPQKQAEPHRFLGSLHSQPSPSQNKNHPVPHQQHSEKHVLGQREAIQWVPAIKIRRKVGKGGRTDNKGKWSPSFLTATTCSWPVLQVSALETVSTPYISTTGPPLTGTADSETPRIKQIKDTALHVSNQPRATPSQWGMMG